jgi:Na+-driven multidrug efflux pump
LGIAGTPALGAFGAGLGSSLAALFALGLHIALATRLRPIPGLKLKSPEWREVRSLLAIGAPVSLQGAMLSVGATVYFGVIARLGVAAVAAVNVMNSLMLIFVLAASGFGVAAATLVGRALGQGNAGNAQRAGWETATLSAAVTASLALILALAPKAVLSFFIARPETLAMAATPLRIVALSVGLSSFALTISYALRGAGATKAPALASFALLWFAQIPMSWLVGVRLGYGLPGVACVLFGSAAVEAVVMALIWRVWARRRSANGDSPHPAALTELA